MRALRIFASKLGAASSGNEFRPTEAWLKGRNGARCPIRTWHGATTGCGPRAGGYHDEAWYRDGRKQGGPCAGLIPPIAPARSCFNLAAKRRLSPPPRRYFFL
jgi:hypothetical protein